MTALGLLGHKSPEIYLRYAPVTRSGHPRGFQRARGRLETAIKEYDLPLHAITTAGRGCVTYRKERVRNYRDYLTIDKKFAYLSWLYQCNGGVLMAPGAEENWTLSVQHSEDDVLRYVRNFESMAKALRS